MRGMNPRWFQIRLRNVFLATICAAISLSTWRYNYHLDVVARRFEAVSVYALTFGTLGVGIGVLFGRMTIAIVLGIAVVVAAVVCDMFWWQP
jgi:hypothetical protein